MKLKKVLTLIKGYWRTQRARFYVYRLKIRGTRVSAKEEFHHLLNLDVNFAASLPHEKRRLYHTTIYQLRDRLHALS